MLQPLHQKDREVIGIMDIDAYAKILLNQRNNMTPEMIEAIEKQGQLHIICEAKQNRFYELEEKYRTIFKQGVDLLFEQHPELRDELPNKETRSEQIRAIADEVQNPNSGSKRITRLMKTIPQLVEAEAMNVELAEACLDFFIALSNLNAKISSDRKTFFSEEYMTKMDKLADDGVIMYFLETPDFPLLSEECDANYVLDSFIFGEYMSAKTLLESFFTISMPGEPLRRKQEDIDSAMCNMLSGFQRTAARNWFSLLESEHKRCANVLEGFWEKAREFKNGFQRSKKIQELFDRAIDVEWELRAWNKIDIYYQKMVGKVQPGVVNRNALIHGDYEDDVMDITDRDVIKIMLMWINMRLIADHFCYIEELFENRLTMVPYLCTLPQDLAIDIMSIM